MKEMTKKSIESLVEQKVWFTLKEICLIKGIPYKSVCNNVYLQPNNGNPDAIISGRKRWNRKSVIEWVLQSDADLLLMKQGG